MYRYNYSLLWCGAGGSLAVRTKGLLVKGIAEGVDPCVQPSVRKLRCPIMCYVHGFLKYGGLMEGQLGAAPALTHWGGTGLRRLRAQPYSWQAFSAPPHVGFHLPW